MPEVVYSECNIGENICFDSFSKEDVDKIVELFRKISSSSSNNYEGDNLNEYMIYNLAHFSSVIKGYKPGQIFVDWNINKDKLYKNECPEYEVLKSNKIIHENINISPSNFCNSFVYDTLKDINIPFKVDVFWRNFKESEKHKSINEYPLSVHYGISNDKKVLSKHLDYGKGMTIRESEEKSQPRYARFLGIPEKDILNTFEDDDNYYIDPPSSLTTEEKFYIEFVPYAFNHNDDESIKRAITNGKRYYKCLIDFSEKTNNLKQDILNFKYKWIQNNS